MFCWLPLAQWLIEIKKTTVGLFSGQKVNCKIRQSSNPAFKYSPIIWLEKYQVKPYSQSIVSHLHTIVCWVISKTKRKGQLNSEIKQKTTLDTKQPDFWVMVLDLHHILWLKLMQKLRSSWLWNIKHILSGASVSIPAHKNLL